MGENDQKMAPKTAVLANTYIYILGDHAGLFQNIKKNT